MTLVGLQVVPTRPLVVLIDHQPPRREEWDVTDAREHLAGVNARAVLDLLPEEVATKLLPRSLAG